MTALPFRQRPLLRAALFSTCTLLAACGGSGGGGAADNRVSTPATVGDNAPATPAAGPGDTPDAARTGSVQLAWIAPQTNADGTPLSDLAGYRVRYGTQSGSYSNTIDIPSPHTLNHVLTGLPPSTYYLVVTAYNSENVESVTSVEVSKSIE